MIVFEGDPCFSNGALKAMNWVLYNFIEPVIDLMDIFHLDPNNYAETIAELEDYFPEYLIRENSRLCIDVLLDLASWTRDEFLHKMKVIHEYALYMILLHECECLDDMGEEGKKLLKSYFDYPRMDEVSKPEREYFEYMREEGFDAIINFLYKDLDFLFADYISSWELTRNPINQILGVDMERLSPLLPKDIREQLDEIYHNNNVFRILSAVQSAIESLQGKPALLENKSEEEINAQIAMGMNMALSHYGLGVSQETPFGYSPKGTGEVDFYVFESEFQPRPTAIGKGKMWGSFRKEIDQLMGYMNEEVELGFTITINKNQNLDTILKKQKEILEKYLVEQNDFKVQDIQESKFGGWICLQRHPENKKPFITNHFTLNLYRPSRKEAAKKRQKKKK